MASETITTVIGVIASVFIAVALLPQLVKLVREKKPHGVSYLTLGSLFLGTALWIAYGFLKSDPIIIVSNSVSLLLNSSISILSIKYRNNG